MCSLFVYVCLIIMNECTILRFIIKRKMCKFKIIMFDNVIII